MMSYNDRHPFWFNKVALCDARLYDIYCTEGILTISLLNSIIIPLQMELTGRINLGEGALDFKVYEAANLLILSKNVMNSNQSRKLTQVFKEMSIREMKSIFEEIGFQLCHERQCKIPEHPYEFVDPEKVSLDKVLPDRRELDKIVFEVLGLTEEEQFEVYRAVVELVKNRLVKARSV